MRTTITIDDDTLSELLELTATTNRTKAVNLAVHAFIRHERLRRFKRLRGALPHLPDNDDIEAPEQERQASLAEPV